MNRHFYLRESSRTNSYSYQLDGIKIPRPTEAYLHDLERFYFGGILDMRTKAQVNQRSTPINCTSFRRKQILNVVHLVFAVPKHFFEIWYRYM